MTDQLHLHLPGEDNDGDALGLAEVARVFDPARLTQARCLAGLTKAALAAAVGVTPAAVSQWEARTTPPRPDHLLKLSEILDMPIGFFALGRPHARLDAATAHFRSLRSTRASQRAKAVAFVEQVWELAHALEQRIQLPAVDLPGFDTHIIAEDVPADPATAARLLRERWNLSNRPIAHLVRTMETKGIVVTTVPFAGDETSRIDAFSTSHLPRPLVVLTPDRADDVFRQRFTAAHELGHLLLHRNSSAGDPSHEHEANVFAAEFLTPAATIADLLPSRVDFHTLAELSRVWGVSIKSLIYRARELGVISDASARRAYQRLNSLTGVGLFAPEPAANYPGETASLLSKAFDLAHHHGLLTFADLARELHWRAPRLRLLLGQPVDKPTLRLITDTTDAQKRARADALSRRPGYGPVTGEPDGQSAAGDAEQAP
ncbi:XRE family transcriptional regulator [Actinokineospora bangkokensis]|uniref:DNA-binding protein n=1 Tax=Actinokineospora bangkokensis TaxID=1193682 RepID=A0A1Q9LIX1_9PSEU|nr:XRE family transcriptional regulator [Actinokineospora bangkokensis]OLR91950.1 DNA-binding protein [Actinokineospora bangkokensis]